MKMHGSLGVAFAAFALTSSAATPVAAQNRFEKDGVMVEFAARPWAGSRTELMDGDSAEISFRITDASGQPMKSLRPAGWMDIGKAREALGEQTLSCKEKISLYLRGIVGMRPMLDLNSYYLLVLNKDPSISVIDPLVGMTGRTNLFATVVLKKPGQDWVKSRDQKRLYVSMPRANQVAVVDTDAFKVIGNVDTGESPARVALQPDGRYLWVGNDAQPGKVSGVTMIDTETLQPVATIATGKGHHEIAFSGDDRYAFVTNRADGSVSVIDIQARAKIKDVATGGVPISLDYSRQAEALYVADGKLGTVSVIDGRRHERVATIALKPGLGPLRFTPDGRYGLVVNPQQDAVYVIEPGTNRLKHTLTVSGEPYQITFTRGFAHVRSLASERVSMISLAGLRQDLAPAPGNFAAGVGGPKQAGDLVLAPQIAMATGEAAVLVVNPADGAIHYYMEGMNAPSGTFKSYGHAPRAIEVVDRSLKESEPGVYSTKVNIPVAGTYDVAFIMDQPRIINCFSVTAKENPLIKRDRPAFSVEYLVQERNVTVGETVPLRFKLIDPGLKGPRPDLKDAVVTYFVAPGHYKTQTLAREVEHGVYEADVKVPAAGTLYAYVGVPSLKLGNNDLVFLSLSAKEAAHEHHQHHGKEGDEHSQHKATPESGQPAAARAIELKLAEAKLVDQHGAALDFKADVVGEKIVVMDFVYTTCTTVCPVMSALFAQVQERLGSRAGSGVALVSVSVDPVRDTPARLKEYSAKYQAGPGWTWLTGPKQVMDGVLKSLGAYTPSFVDHPTMVMVGDGRTGTWTRYYGFPDPDQIVAKVNELGAARARSASAHKEH